MNTRGALSGCAVVGFLSLFSGTATAQEGLQTAKDLYASAAYEDALTVLSRLQRSDAPAEVQQYRAFCLIALGRLGEAEKAIESLVVANPRYQPTAMDVSPRIQEAFERTRKQLLPDIVRQLYGEAKQAFDRKDRSAAISGFQSVVEIIDEASPDVRESLDELRFLAAGFRDLSSALREPQAEKETAGANAPAESTTKPPVPIEITPPVAIRQVMPPWVPSDAVSRQAVFAGSIRVSISASGRVETAEMVRPIHPVYDRLLLQAAKDWLYQPARRDGLSVPSELLVEVQLKPRQ